MTKREILEIAIQIIGVYLIFTAAPALLSSIVIGCAMAVEVNSLEMRKFMSAGVAGPFLKLCFGFWAAFGARSISRAFRPYDD